MEFHHSTPQFLFGGWTSASGALQARSISIISESIKMSIDAIKIDQYPPYHGGDTAAEAG
jgi:hypothetical protein